MATRDVHSFSVAGDDLKSRAMMKIIKTRCKDPNISFSGEILKALKARESILKNQVRSRVGGSHD